MRHSNVGAIGVVIAMPHAFDGCNFEQVLADTVRLVSDARRHEQSLAGVVNLLEATGSTLSALPGATPAVNYANLAAAPGWPHSPDLLALIRAACVAGRHQRELAERILMALLGDHGTENGRARVLVVDDTEDNRELAATVLENAGFHSITAANGLEGVIAAHCLRPVAILMDVTMPVLGGIEAARLLKASAATRSLNVIAYTAKPDFYEGPITRLFVGVLPKPASPEAIVSKVLEFV
jgi:CheY-like chemotaxis protein